VRQKIARTKREREKEVVDEREKLRKILLKDYELNRLLNI
jgi:hypothetical protein